jgi:hypothetical protein
VLQSARPGDRHIGGAVEDPAPAIGSRALRGGVEHLLEDSGHGQDERRVEGAEVVEKTLDVRGVPRPHPRLDAADLNDPREDVRQR